MSKLRDPDQAWMLARAVVSDVSLYNEKFVVRSRQKGKIIRPLREALQEAWELFESRVDVAVPECAACFEKALDEILQLSITVAPAGAPVSAPVETLEESDIEIESAPGAYLDPSVVSVLNHPGADTRRIERLVAGCVGQTVAGACMVERVTLTTESRLPTEAQFGRTVIGTMPDGLKVAVAFPKARSEAIQEVKEGSSYDIRGTVVLWDPLFRYLVLAASG